MKKLITLFSIIILPFCGQTQYVTINDVNFSNWLQTNYPTCMVGNQMDTTCSDIVLETTVICSNKNISDLDGIQYFDNLEFLFAEYNDLTTLPIMPQTSLKKINVFLNDLNSISQFPPLLEELIISNNPNLTSIAPLPNSLKVYLGSNLTNLPVPAFPNGLVTCTLVNCGLTSFPTIPSTLGHLELTSNNLGNFPPNYLPSNLTFLGFWYCNVSVMPPLPSTITSLFIGGNSIPNITTLPPNLLYLEADYNPGITTLPGLPDSMQQVSFTNCNITTVDSLPTYCKVVKLSNNAITSIPNFPINIETVEFQNNNISSIPPIPSSVYSFKMTNNNMSCWEPFPPNLLNLFITDNPFTCLPNLPSGIGGILATYPLCDFNDPATNPLGCATAEGIEGVVYNDPNLSCTYTGVEAPLNGVNVKLFDNAGNLQELTSTGSTGRYNLLASNNIFDVVIDTLNKPYTYSCSNPGIDSTVSILLPDSLIQNVNFGLICKPGFDVGTISAHTNGFIFPGQPHQLKIKSGDLSNMYGLGCASGVSGTVTVTITGPVSFINSASGALTPSVSGLTFTYTIADFGIVNLDTDFKLNLQVNPSANSGDAICVNVITTPLSSDNVPSNNTFNYCYSVVNSYDPNNKLVYPEVVEPEFYDYLTYTINFQNTGDAPAFNIRLEDTISNLLDINTFEMIDASHTNHYKIINNKLTIYYPNIMLEDSTTNLEGSKGYFQYRIKPLTGYPVNTQIENTAHIFFDFNSAIVTNTAVTDYQINSSNLSSNSVNDNFVLYPNPTNDVFFITTNGDQKITEVTIFDELGRQLGASQTMFNNNLTQVTIDGNKTGLFLVRIATENEFYYKRILIK